MEEVILTFDQGNTRAKLSVFRIMADGGCRVEGEFRYESAPTVEDVAELVETYGISGAIYCSNAAYRGKQATSGAFHTFKYTNFPRSRSMR